MPLTHFTDRNVVRLLSTQTRRVDVTPHDLTRSHVALGRFLAGELVDRLPLEPCEIRHPQGVRQGWRVAQEAEIAVLCFMRAGLYVTEGVREVLTSAPVFHVSPGRGTGLSEETLKELPSLEGRAVIIVDSVINTGASLDPVLRQVRALGPGRLVVLSLVSPVATAERLTVEHPDVQFLLARISDNQYVGKGATDTGNRLFGTLPAAGERRR